MSWIIYLGCLVCLFQFQVARGYYDYIPGKDTSAVDDYLDIDALNTFQQVQKKSYRNYKRYLCRRWNSHCSPWSNQPGYSCCSGLSCKCNIWMQNCRCLTRLWGK